MLHADNWQINQPHNLKRSNLVSCYIALLYLYVPMKIVEQLKKPIAKEMELFEEKFSSSMRSNVALLNRITY